MCLKTFVAKYYLKTDLNTNQIVCTNAAKSTGTRHCGETNVCPQISRGG